MHLRSLNLDGSARSVDQCHHNVMGRHKSHLFYPLGVKVDLLCCGSETFSNQVAHISKQEPRFRIFIAKIVREPSLLLNWLTALLKLKAILYMHSEEKNL